MCSQCNNGNYDEPLPEKPGEQGRYDSDPQIAQGLTERDIIQRQIESSNANLLMVMRAIWSNYRSR